VGSNDDCPTGRGSRLPAPDGASGDGGEGVHYNVAVAVRARVVRGRWPTSQDPTLPPPAPSAAGAPVPCQAAPGLRAVYHGEWAVNVSVRKLWDGGGVGEGGPHPPAPSPVLTHRRRGDVRVAAGRLTGSGARDRGPGNLLAVALRVCSAPRLCVSTGEGRPSAARRGEGRPADADPPASPSSLARPPNAAYASRPVSTARRSP